jgi:amidase
MKILASVGCSVVAFAVGCGALGAETKVAVTTKSAAMDRDLMEVTVPRLEAMYASHKYTVTQVVQWYLARIEKYNGIYRAVQYVNTKDALETSAREDAEAKAGGANFHRGRLWGVPIVTKENTSVKGLIT